MPARLTSAQLVKLVSGEAAGAGCDRSQAPGPSCGHPKKCSCCLTLNLRAVLLQAPGHACPSALQVDWKLTRGKWRPRLLGFAKDLSAAQVRTLAAVMGAAAQWRPSSYKLACALGPMLNEPSLWLCRGAPAGLRID